MDEPATPPGRPPVRMIGKTRHFQSVRREYRLVMRRALLPAATPVASLVTGCYHMITPVNPERLPDDVAALQIYPRRAARLVNGDSEETVTWFRSEGIHHIGADLREWTDRILLHLQSELEPRGVSVVIGEETAPSAELAVLRIWVTEIVAPDARGGGGAVVRARVQSDDGNYAAEFSSGVTSHGFSDALYNLKKSILVDPALSDWFRQAGPGL